MRPDLQSPFLSAGWAQAVERAQGPGARVVLASDGGVVEAVLAARAGRVTAWPLGAPFCDIQGLIAEPGFVCDPRNLVHALGVQRYDFSHMTGTSDPFASAAQGGDVSYVVDLSAGFDAWAAARKAAGSGLLKDLAKRRRRLETTLGPTRFTALSSSREDLDRLIAWKRRKFAQTRQTDLFAAAWPHALIDDLFQARGPGVRAGLFTLHAGDTLVAVQLHLIGAAAVHGWLIAQGDGAEACSPGLLLFEDVLRWMDGHYRELDLGTCDYGFKGRFANAHREVRHGYVGASAAGLVRAAEYGLRRAAEALPLGRVSAWPGKAMRRLDLWRTLNAGAA
jgi:CelD/BcsL family acetyltransferase involved in cellulose biosynthesis